MLLYRKRRVCGGNSMRSVEKIKKELRKVNKLIEDPQKKENRDDFVLKGIKRKLVEELEKAKGNVENLERRERDKITDQLESEED
jgi:hypothetical protein